MELCGCLRSIPLAIGLADTNRHNANKLFSIHLTVDVSPSLTFFTLASFNFSSASLILSAFNWASISSCRITHKRIYSLTHCPHIDRTVEKRQLQHDTMDGFFLKMLLNAGGSHLVLVQSKVCDVCVHYLTKTWAPYVHMCLCKTEKMKPTLGPTLGPTLEPTLEHHTLWGPDFSALYLMMR